MENKHWATEEELTDYYAIGQCTPGIIAVNTATFIGQKYKASLHCTPWGGVLSLVIILILAGAHQQLRGPGLGPERLCGHSGVRVRPDFQRHGEVTKKSVVDKPTAAIFLAVLVGSAVMDVSPVWFILAAAVLGILLKNWEVKGA